MQAYHVVSQAERTGAYLRERLCDLASRYPAINLVRGRGMLQAIVFDRDGFATEPSRRIGLDVALRARHNGLLLRAAPWFVAVAPPLIATTQDVDAIVDILADSLPPPSRP
jgi:4-aminobutyrate aminotransferase-like enzyme